MYWRVGIWIDMWRRYDKMFTFVESTCLVLNCEYLQFFSRLKFHNKPLGKGEWKEGMQSWSRMENLTIAFGWEQKRVGQDFLGERKFQLGSYSPVCQKASQHESQQFSVNSQAQPALSHQSSRTSEGQHGAMRVSPCKSVFPTGPPRAGTRYPPSDYVLTLNRT